MGQPHISICIPAYKAERFLADTLASVAAQTFSDWELIVTEDGSSDRTREIVQRFAATVAQRVIYNRHETNRGLPIARNTGIAATTGEWIAFIDSDDLWKPEHLQSLVATARGGDYDLVFAGTLPFDDVTGKQLQPCLPTTEDLQDLPVALYTGRLSVLPSSAMVRRRAFDRYGMISTDFPHANDTEYWLRILRGGGRAGYTGSATCLYRKHASAMSLRASRILTNTAQICERYGDWPSIPRSIARRRTGNLYRYAGRATLPTDTRAARALLLRSLRVDPWRIQTWASLVFAWIKGAQRSLGSRAISAGKKSPSGIETEAKAAPRVAAPSGTR